MGYFDPQKWHEELMKNISPQLAYKEGEEFKAWQAKARNTLERLLGLPLPKTEPNVRVEYERKTEEFLEKRFIFTSEGNVDVPCHLLIPKSDKAEDKKVYPLVICLQGHSKGMHISLGRAKYPGDEQSIAGDRDFAIQAVKEGYAALAIEQRCFGERGGTSDGPNCYQSTMSALLLGRTTIGERVWDISRAIDVIEKYFPEIDSSRIACMGNSGGGTITYYAACLDERIAVAMPSCAVCNYVDSIGTLYHCSCNYIPGIYKYFEMGDLAGLIAPRPLIVVAGRKDDIFPIAGVQRSFERIKELYRAAGAEDRCRLVIGEGGHRFYARESWPVFRDLSGWGMV